jgi:hypothetical protein
VVDPALVAPRTHSLTRLNTVPVVARWALRQQQQQQEQQQQCRHTSSLWKKWVGPRAGTPASRERVTEESTDPGSHLVLSVAKKSLQTAIRKHCFYCSVFVPLALRAWCSTAVSSSTIRLHRSVLIHGRVALR